MIPVKVTFNLNRVMTHSLRTTTIKFVFWRPEAELEEKIALFSTNCKK